MSIKSSFKTLVIRMGLKFPLQRIAFNYKRAKETRATPTQILRDLAIVQSPEMSSVDLLIVAPFVDSRKQPWEAAGGNYFYEIYQSAVEYFTDKVIELHRVENSDFNWISSLAIYVNENNPRIILFQVETDPNNSGEWNIDVAVRTLKKMGWNGLLLLLSYDSVFPLHLYRIDRVVRLYKNAVVISIDRPCKDFYRGRAPNIHSLFLPISQESLSVLKGYFLSAPHYPLANQFSFIGAEYGYREEILANFQESGANISINPHKARGTGFAPYKEYALALRSSLATLNFSRAHTFDIAQVKSRVLESMLFHCVLITDDYRILEKLFDVKKHFLYFESAEDLKRIHSELISKPQMVQEITSNAFEKADTLNKNLFWGSISRYFDQP